MTEGKISTPITPSQRRRATVSLNPENVLEWLAAMRDNESADRDEAFAAADNMKANGHDARCTMYARAHEDIVGLMSVNAELTKVMRRRVLVAFHESELPPWVPTHKHYKGTLYRVTGLRYNASGEELVEGIEYDDAAGHRFWIERSKFESILPSGKARYELLTEGKKVD